MVNPLPPTRAELAQFLPDHASIRAFEQLFKVAGELTPNEIAQLGVLIQEAAIQADSAGAQAAAANGALDRIAGALELLATAPRHDLADSDSLADLAPPITPPKRSRFGSFYDTTTQTAAVINTAYTVTFNTTDLSEGVYLGSPTSRVYVDDPGIYNFQFSAQLDKASGGLGVVDIWYRLNGADVANSSTRIRIQGNDAETVAAWNFLVRMKAGDYFELAWAVDNTDCQITASGPVAPHPGIPSVLLSVTNNIGA
jgi:hypothetical protein